MKYAWVIMQNDVPAAVALTRSLKSVNAEKDKVKADLKKEFALTHNQSLLFANVWTIRVPIVGVKT